jgi:cystathionine gamma-synthase
MKIETKAVHAGELKESSRDVTPAIHLSTTFEKAADGSLPGGHLYARPSNPNRDALEHALAIMEDGAAALAFSAGSAATLAVLQSLAPGDHVIAGSDVFYGTLTLLKNLMTNWGLTFSLVNMQDLSALEQAITPQTRLIWLETPSNPLLSVSDIAGIVAIAQKYAVKTRKILVACDNTVATSMNQRPLQLGVDITMHSVTKYLSGHSDVLGGALIFKTKDVKTKDGREAGALFEKIQTIQREGGSVPSPFEAWLTLRGMQTFPYRMRAHCENAQRVAEFLSRHAKVEAVHYPGLPTHPGHKIAARQMSAFGGLLSIQIKGGQAEAFKVCGAVKIFTHATSLGGTHSFIEHRKSVEGVNSRSPENLLRLSIGLEHPDDLIEDLEQALRA